MIDRLLNDLDLPLQTKTVTIHLFLLKNSFHLKLIMTAVTFILILSNMDVIAQPLQLNYSGKNIKIVQAVEEANKILINPNFYNRIDTIQNFDNSTYTGLQISTEFKNLHRIIQVVDYWNPFGFANATTVSVIKLNTAKLRRSHKSITNTVIHETVHAVDWWSNEKWDYTHDGNRPEGQNNTAPWVIGAIAVNFIN